MFVMKLFGWLLLFGPACAVAISLLVFLVAYAVFWSWDLLKRAMIALAYDQDKTYEEW